MRFAPALALGMAVVTLLVPGSAAAPSGVHVPKGWPSKLEIGVTDGPGDAAKLAARAPVGFRYQYLAGRNGCWLGDGTRVASFVSTMIASGRAQLSPCVQLLTS
jgi:hypothetical protein